MMFFFSLRTDVDVWRHLGDRALLARGPHLPQAQPLQVADGGERAEEELGAAGGSLAGRLQEVLLREDRERTGK